MRNLVTCAQGPFVDAGVANYGLIHVAVVAEYVGLVGLMEDWGESEGTSGTDGFRRTVFEGDGEVLTTWTAFWNHWQFLHFFFLETKKSNMS